MSWYYNNLRITVVGLEEANEQIIAQLQPLSAKTAYQVFGWTENEANLEALIVGSGDLNILSSMIDDGVPYTLSGAGMYLGDYYLQSMNWAWTTTFRQTFREDKPDDDLVFRVTLTLLKET